MSSNKSPGNARPDDGSKQGNEQQSGQADNPRRDHTFDEEGGGAGGQQGQDAGRAPGERNGSDSGGGKS